MTRHNKGIFLKNEISKRCNFPLKKSYVAAFLHAFQLNEILKLGVLNIICPITSDQLFALFFFFYCMPFCPLFFLSGKPYRSVCAAL